MALLLFIVLLMKEVCLSDIDWGRVSKMETLFIFSFFDVCELQLNVGCKPYHLVYILFPSIIVLLPLNGFLEHIFKACTWFDNQLRQRLKDLCFEMAILISVNDSLIRGVVPTEEKAKAVIASVEAQFDKKGDHIGQTAKTFLDPTSV